MRQIALALLSMILWTLPARATISLVQHACNAACSGSSCNVTVSSTGSGHLIVASMISDSGSGAPSITSVSGGGTYTHCSNCRAVQGSNAVDASYTTNSSSGATAITLNSSASSTWEACIHEVSTTLTPFALDSGTTPSCSGAITSAVPKSCNLTVSGANLFIATAILWGGTITGASSPYGSALEPNGNGSASNTATTSGTGASWTPTTSNSGAAFSIAFKESAAAARCQSRALLGVGC